MATPQLRKVLVIDDEEAVIELIQNVLTMHQYKTIATTQLFPSKMPHLLPQAAYPNNIARTS